jgi:hypothetical protein
MITPLPSGGWGLSEPVPYCSCPTSLNDNIENQLASLSSAVARLIETLKGLQK